MKVTVPFSTMDFETGETTFRFTPEIMNQFRWRCGKAEIDLSDITVPISEPMIAPQEISEAVEHPTTTQGREICANTVCYYCEHFDGEHCNVPCGIAVGGSPSSFLGRKLSPVA